MHACMHACILYIKGHFFEKSKTHYEKENNKSVSPRAQLREAVKERYRKAVGILLVRFVVIAK
jgi:hypothetical protein